MSHPLVSIVIPTYGRPDQLRACLEALAGQSVRPDDFEVLVVDDGSPVSVEPIALEFSDRIRVRVIRQANAGPASARNRGVAESSSELIAFTDDDCRPSPRWLAQLIEMEGRHPAAMVGGETLNGLPDDLLASTSQLIVDLVYEHFNASRERAVFLASNNFLCRRDLFLRLGGFDTHFPRAGAEDRDFCDRWRWAGMGIVWCQEAVVVHEHPQTLRKFFDLHWRYGRGARLYHVKRQMRGSGTTLQDARFHAALPRLLWQHRDRMKGICRGITMGAALVLWQVVNAAGFVRQALADAQSPTPAPGGERR